MKYGYTHREALDLWHGVARQAAAFWDEPKFLDIDARVVNMALPQYGGPQCETSEAFTSAIDPECDRMQVMFDSRADPEGFQKRAAGFGHYQRINGLFLPYVWQDELLNIAAHEMAHCVTMFDDANQGHGPVWHKEAKAFGAYPHEYLNPRNIDDVPFRYFDSRFLEPGNTLGPVFE